MVHIFTFRSPLSSFSTPSFSPTPLSLLVPSSFPTPQLPSPLLSPSPPTSSFLSLLPSFPPSLLSPSFLLSLFSSIFNINFRTPFPFSSLFSSLLSLYFIPNLISFMIVFFVIKELPERASPLADEEFSKRILDILQQASALKQVSLILLYKEEGCYLL